jgi:hypothetical protein
MSPRFLKWSLTIAALMFLSQGCAVFVRDEDGHHYRHGWWSRHSSIEQPNKPVNQVVAHEEDQRAVAR